MSSAKEFREYADECMDWARTARSEKERAIFIEMAQTWLAAAARREPGTTKWVEEFSSDGARKNGPDGRYTATRGGGDDRIPNSVGTPFRACRMLFRPSARFLCGLAQ